MVLAVMMTMVVGDRDDDGGVATDDAGDAGDGGDGGCNDADGFGGGDKDGSSYGDDNDAGGDNVFIH